MKLIELFNLERKEEPVPSEEPMPPAEALSAAFAILTRHDKTVSREIEACVADTEKYYSDRGEVLERRGLCYSKESSPWLCVIAAVEAAAKEGHLREVSADCSADVFSGALKGLLAASGMVFSIDKIKFDDQKNLNFWVRQFNEYAGQSGITLYFVDLYTDACAMGVARIADYAEAAEIAGYAGVKITCRPA